MNDTPNPQPEPTPSSVPDQTTAPEQPDPATDTTDGIGLEADDTAIESETNEGVA